MGDLWGRVRKKGVLSLGEIIGPGEIRLKIPGMNPIGVCRGQDQGVNLTGHVLFETIRVGTVTPMAHWLVARD